MYSSNKIDSFAISRNENHMFCGTYTGSIFTFDIETLSLLSSVKDHNGSISAICSHNKYNHICVLGLDNYVSIYKYNNDGLLQLLHHICVRRISPAKDMYDRTVTTSQSIAFHPSERKIVTRGGSSATIEISYNETEYKILWSHRFHGNWDFIACRYANCGKLLFTMSNSGDIVLSNKRKVLRTWEIHKYVGYDGTHWIEPLNDFIYLVANDCGRVIAINIDQDEPVYIGELVAIDHLEHITYNKTSRKAYISSFDRTIKEINIEDGSLVRTVWEAPFKCRWIKVLEKDCNVMIVQCRNGGIYKINILTSEVIAYYKDTPDALWTADKYKDGFILAGEGNYFYQYMPRYYNEQALKYDYKVKRIEINDNEFSYTKRLICTGEEKIFFARTNGKLFAFDGNRAKLIFEAFSAIRDITYDFYDKSLIYFVCENGQLIKLNIDSEESEILYQSNTSLWALAYRPNSPEIYFADRKRNIYSLNLKTHKTNKHEFEMGFIKRMRFIDEDTLLFSRSSRLMKYSISKSEFSCLIDLPNTVEDMIWDDNKKYIILISYTRNIYLLDFSTGELLHEQGQAIDYIKGGLYLSDGDFITFGRCGKPFYNRINDERLIPYGYV